jgi:hypothetical protein
VEVYYYCSSELLTGQNKAGQRSARLLGAAMPFPTKPKKHRELGGALERFLGNLSFITTLLQTTERELDHSLKLSAINYSC